MTWWQRTLIGAVALPTVIVVGSAVAVLSFLYTAVDEGDDW